MFTLCFRCKHFVLHQLTQICHVHAVIEMGLCVCLIMVFEQINDEDNHIDPSQPAVDFILKLTWLFLPTNLLMLFLQRRFFFFLVPNVTLCLGPNIKGKIVFILQQFLIVLLQICHLIIKMTHVFSSLSASFPSCPLLQCTEQQLLLLMQNSPMHKLWFSWNQHAFCCSWKLWQWLFLFNSHQFKWHPCIKMISKLQFNWNQHMLCCSWQLRHCLLWFNFHQFNDIHTSQFVLQSPATWHFCMHAFVGSLSWVLTACWLLWSAITVVLSTASSLHRCNWCSHCKLLLSGHIAEQKNPSKHRCLHLQIRTILWCNLFLFVA